MSLSFSLSSHILHNRVFFFDPLSPFYFSINNLYAVCFSMITLQISKFVLQDIYITLNYSVGILYYVQIKSTKRQVHTSTWVLFVCLKKAVAFFFFTSRDVPSSKMTLFRHLIMSFWHLMTSLDMKMTLCLLPGIV